MSVDGHHTALRHANTMLRYHSQSPESLFAHVPGLRVVIPRSPIQAKGLLLASIACNDPVVFMEPKILYRAAVEQVPNEAYTLPLSKAEVLKEGKDVTIVSYGTPLYNCSTAITAAEKDFGVSVELIDLRTIYPWDRPTILSSVNKTGRAIVVHESMINSGVGAEVAATIQEGAFLKLEAPVQRVAGWSTHMGLSFEKFNIPDVVRKLMCIQANFLPLTAQGYTMRSVRSLSIEIIDYKHFTPFQAFARETPVVYLNCMSLRSVSFQTGYVMTLCENMVKHLPMTLHPVMCLHIHRPLRKHLAPVKT